MDRRRRQYVPSSEGLEDRQLLSTATPTIANPYGTTTTGVQVDGSPASPQSIESKLHRIQNLPFFLGLLNRDGAVPQPTVQNIQTDLRQFVGAFHQGSSPDVSSFNLDIRKSQPYYKIRPVDNANLNRDFGAVLEAAGANPNVVADLQQQMNDLTAYETSQTNSRIIATNDYATVLQIALSTGRPLVFPNTPSLNSASHNGNKGKVQITHSDQPTLTGQYNAATNIQIVDVNNQTVLGTGAVDTATGVYSVKFAGKLPEGIYTVRVRAEDSGYVSDPSPRFTFEVVLPKPKIAVALATPQGPSK